MSQTTSPLDEIRDEVVKLVQLGLSNAAIVEALANGKEFLTSEGSLRRAFRRWGLRRPETKEEPSHFKLQDDEAEIVSKPSVSLNSPEQLMIERGLDPEEWEVDRITINEWESPLGGGSDETITLKQLKINLKRKRTWAGIMPAREPLKFQRRIPTSFFDVPRLDAELIVFAGDQQAPFHNENLHELFCQWLEFNRPHRGVLIGDTIDLPDISRHPTNPEWAATTQECVDAAYLLLRDYVQSSKDTGWTKLGGNHDERLRRVVINQISDFYGLRQAARPGEELGGSILDAEFLLRLDELGIEYVRPNGSYEHGQVNISNHLAARHGWIARKGSGASALKTLEHLGFSVVVGHTHRQSQVHKTRHDINGDLSTITAVETGCMCRIEEGLGYAVAPDWQNGFATAIVWPDGTFRLELATYVNNTLYWRDQRYK